MEKNDVRYFINRKYALKLIVITKYAKPDGCNAGASVHRQKGELGFG